MNRFSFAIILNILIASCGSVAVAASAPQNERQLEGDPLLDNWEKEEGLANMLNDMIESSKTTSPTQTPTKKPTKRPTNRPTKGPSVSPTLSPSEQPTQDPTLSPTASPSESLQPSTRPSMQPTAHPSIAPTTSAFPSAAPSSKPTLVPTDAPSISQRPTKKPSDQPSVTPTVKPSSGPSKVSSLAPSISKSPTESPTQSTPPSQTPSYTTAMESSIIIDQSKTRNATPLLIVGAACFVVMASIGAFLYKRGSQSRLDIGGRKPTMIDIEVSSPFKSGGVPVSPYSVGDGSIPGQDTFEANYSESDSRATEDHTLDYNYTTHDQRCLENDDEEMIDIDLEMGQVGIDAVPNSVSIITRAEPELTTDNNLAVATIDDEHEILGNHRLRMPMSIYVPKMFQRTREGEENNNRQIVTWNQIRDEDRSPASSGYAPASVPSPMLSPFFVKGLSSILSPYAGKRGAVVDDGSGDKMEGAAGAAATLFFSSSKKSARKGKRKGRTTSPIKEIIVKREVPSASDDVFAGLEESTPSQDDEENSPDGPKSPRTLGSKSSDGSSIEWGIDVSKVQPSKASFEANMTELQNLLVSIKSMGSNEVPNAEDQALSPRSDVQMTYTDDSVDEGSPKSDASTFLGNIDIAPVDSKSIQDNVSTRTESSSLPSYSSPLQAPPPSTPNESAITYKTELLNSSKANGEGTFSFRNIFNDPKNDLYECHAPSGPLGIVVDTTPLGPRVRSLNPLSPIFGNVSPGDVIVGVDEVDTVGMEAGDFWQVVSRKANQQKRILTILRI